ncbi:ribosome maturation factor RimM [Salisaeta longa]|uniref:ribosome maturation factor RimM n=1 Tax=Salisaeta longa TaxID=503170 RepID=UPI00041D53B0|nr:ribosome maturation factor RimM [Salisaeta longa]
MALPDTGMTDAASPPADALVRIGYVFRPHGVRGELKVAPEAESARAFADLATVYVGAAPERARPYDVTGVRTQETKRGLTVLLTLRDVDDRTAAEALAKRTVYAAADDLALDEEELFVHDLIGARVVTDTGTPVGTVADLMPLPGPDVLVIERPGRPDALVPWVEALVPTVDLDAGCITIAPIDGLLD